MRDVNRIPQTLQELQKVWEQFPDLRLGQLLLNAVNDINLYYIEDDKLIQTIITYYKELVND